MKNQFLLLFTFGMILSCISQNKNQSTAIINQKLSGTWKLFYITGPRIAFEGLYPNKKPQIKIDIKLPDAGGKQL